MEILADGDTLHGTWKHNKIQRIWFTVCTKFCLVLVIFEIFIWWCQIRSVWYILLYMAVVDRRVTESNFVWSGGVWISRDLHTQEALHAFWGVLMCYFRCKSSKSRCSLGDGPRGKRSEWIFSNAKRWILRYKSIYSVFSSVRPVICWSSALLCCFTMVAGGCGESRRCPE